MARTPDPELAERRKRQITEAALACFRRRGFHQTSMQEICAEAAISPGALYRYFPSKTDLIAAIAEYEVAASLGELAAHADRPLIDTLCLLVEEHLACAEDGPIIADVLAECSRNPALAARLREIEDAKHEAIAALFEAAQARGEFSRKADARLLSRYYMRFVDGLFLRNALLFGEDPRQDVSAELRGFLAHLFSVDRLAPTAASNHFALQQVD